MRVLLDTNILIHREASKVVRRDIGVLFGWLDRLHVEKCVHPQTMGEIARHADPAVVSTLTTKAQNYHILKTTAADTDEIRKLRESDRTANDATDTSILAELAAGRVQALITEDRGIHRKADAIGLSPYVFTIDSYLEKVTAENPDLVDYKVLSVRKQLFGDVQLKDRFFDSFRNDYPGFDGWFTRKSDEEAYVCTTETGTAAFLYLKREDRGENYSDITPPFRPAKRLKIGTFKVESNGFKLGERFLKIVFDNALRMQVDEIYVTAFPHTEDVDRLVRLLEEWGFHHHGKKSSAAGDEDVYVRNFRRECDADNPKLSYPYISRSARKFIVPIRPQYHTELFPDSILRTESVDDYPGDEAFQNAMSKVYVSRSPTRHFRAGDVVVFYRTRSAAGPAYYTSVATTLGIVESSVARIPDKATFIDVGRKRSVFSDVDLSSQWDEPGRSKPFVLNFLYTYSFPKRPNLESLIANGIIEKAPRSFERLSDQSFDRLMEIAHVDQRLVVD